MCSKIKCKPFAFGGDELKVSKQFALVGTGPPAAGLDFIEVYSFAPKNRSKHDILTYFLGRLRIKKSLRASQEVKIGKGARAAKPSIIHFVRDGGIGCLIVRNLFQSLV